MALKVPAPDRRFDILAIDRVALDIVLKVKRLPGHGEKELGDFVGRLPGGPAANFACAASRQGMRVAALATLGEDEAAQIIIDDFHDFGVDTSYVRQDPARQSNFTVILLEPSGERSIIAVPAEPHIYETALLNELFPQCRALQTMPHGVDRFVRMGTMAQAAGTIVMVDIEATIMTDRAGLEKTLKCVDIASFNARGLVTISGEEATIDGARKLLDLDLGPEMVVVTLGSDGALVVTKEESHQVPGWKVDVVDTTGAGDTFNATFLTGLLQGQPLSECITRANAGAAMAVTGLGPRGCLPTQSEITQFLAQATQEES